MMASPILTHVASWLVLLCWLTMCPTLILASACKSPIEHLSCGEFVGAQCATEGAPVLVHIETELGNIVVAVDTISAPITASNFLRYVQVGAYDGGSFHRTVTMQNQPDKKVKIEVIQGGTRGGEKDDFPAIPLERTSTTGLSHRDGTISMARDGPDTHANLPS